MSMVARPEFQCKQPYGATSARALQVFPLRAPSPFGSTIAQWQCIARPRPQGPCGTTSILFPISWLRAALQVNLPFHVAVNSRRHNLVQHGSPRGHSHGSRKLHSHSYLHSPSSPRAQPPHRHHCALHVPPPPAPSPNLPQRLPLVSMALHTCVHEAFLNTTPGNAQDVQLGGTGACVGTAMNVARAKLKASEILGTSASWAPEPSESEAKEKEV